MMLSILFAYFVVVAGTEISRLSVWAYVFAISGLAITWYETIRAWRRTP
jgi:hypothetical protein